MPETLGNGEDIGDNVDFTEPLAISFGDQRKPTSTPDPTTKTKTKSHKNQKLLLKHSVDASFY